ncbi:hypothetical protein Tco_0666470 [Tanacetum coccineum]
MDLCTCMGNLEYGHGLLVKKVITVSDAEVADSIVIGEIGPRVSTMEDQIQVWKSVGYGVSKCWIRRIQVLDTAYWGFLGVGATFDIFQNIILIPYFEYGILGLSGYGVLIFTPMWSLVSAGTDTPYLP